MRRCDVHARTYCVQVGVRTTCMLDAIFPTSFLNLFSISRSYTSSERRHRSGSGSYCVWISEHGNIYAYTSARTRYTLTDTCTHRMICTCMIVCTSRRTSNCHHCFSILFLNLTGDISRFLVLTVVCARSSNLLVEKRAFVLRHTAQRSSNCHRWFLVVSHPAILSSAVQPQS